MKSIAVVIAVLAMSAAPAFAACDLTTADAAKGEKKFALCKACHTVVEKVNKVGPHLDGIIDRPAASIADFVYSDAMKAFGATGAKWDFATLDTYLTKPKVLVPNTKMVFAGFAKEEDRCNMIKFLQGKPAL